MATTVNNSDLLCEIAGRLMRQAAAPYHEHAVRMEAEKICAEHGLKFRRDAFGNVLVRYQTAPRLRPFAVAAHLDHPGFEVMGPLPGRRWRAQFFGGVGDSYFLEGVPVRLMPGAVPAKLGKRIGPEKQFVIRAERAPTDAPRFAVWELEDFAVRRGRIYGRSCDDLIGVASILAVLITLKRRRTRANVIGVISRAEEVGFHGALTVAAGRQLPKDSLVISLETSRELPPVKMGCGVILRVGDRTSIFDSTATRFLAEVAGALKLKGSSFQVQRALMSGGTCEATAYQEYGFQTAAVCVALGNYHNCTERNKIAAEYVSVADACGMVELLVSAAVKMRNYRALTVKLPGRLDKMMRVARRRLRGG